MRDDAVSIVAELYRFYEIKLQLLHKLLLSETDKLHYGRSGNLEKVIVIIENDAADIDDIDLIDFDISKAETALSALIGVQPRMLYDLLGGSGDAHELIAVRDRVIQALNRLFRERTELGTMLGSASQAVQKSIDDLSRLCRLKEAGTGNSDPPRR